ncbi:hypothetical protein ACLIBH_07520 [Virgibacillus sp. W0430]|uniref:hypothetical protein n=1 Tax=Virgibacillus sp. W0430 TaxID=3391580 RepID=UPI003F451C8A
MFWWSKQKKLAREYERKIVEVRNKLASIPYKEIDARDEEVSKLKQELNIYQRKLCNIAAEE